jgi:large subunit ribosomal protein L4
MELSIYNTNGQPTGKVSLADNIYGIEPNDHAIYLDVKLYLANQRQGTHKSKERGEVRASTRKLRKQKGVGSARTGGANNPLFKGGGRIFGPKPRDYGFKLNKKLKIVARKSALAYKAKDEKIKVLQNFDLDQPKTKDFVAILGNLDLTYNKTLFVTKDKVENLVLASRNIPNAKVVRAEDLNTYEILNADHLVLTEGSISRIEEILNRFES